MKIFGLSFVSRPFARRCLAIFASQCLCANAFAASVLPTGGQYVAGQGTIATAPKGVVVNQSSTHGIVNWQGFSIGAGNTVQFNNGSGATLNRVTGGDLSQIDGVLKATGSVYLINPQGIVVGSGGKIVTKGSFVGSTRDVNSADFMNGNALHAMGTSSGNVVNQGSITSQYGDTILVGNSVSNNGTISAPNGTAGLAAGNDVLLRPMGGDARIAVSGGQGNVTNTGTIAAAQAELAAAGGNVYALAGNSGGLVSATGTKTVDGHVWLTSGGTTEVAGTIKATNSSGSGGTIVATGKNVQIDSTARISANGTTGGTVLIGGDMRGGYDPSAKRVSAAVANAQTTTVANGAQISADGTRDAGGAVVIWSDDHTFFDGKISATGTNGDGGDAEVSSHNILDFTGVVDLTSKYADMGTLLLDPNNLTISGSTTSNAGSSPNYVAGATTSVLKASDLVAALNSANISVTASGTLTVFSAISWTGATTLTLTSGGELAVNAAITGSNANSGLALNSTAADVYLQSGVINVHTFTATAATEIVNASGTFTNASGIATLNAGMAAGIGDPNYGVLSLSGTITAGTLTLNAQGWVYPGFTIKATNLLATGGGTFNLFSSSTISQTTSANVIGTLAANVTGELNVSNNGNLIIGSVNGVNGVTAGTFHLTFPSAKTLTQTQPIVATTMALLGTGAGTYTLTNPNNSIANFGAKVATGTLSLFDTGFNIAGSLTDDNGNSLTNGIAATTLTLTDIGNVTQTGTINVTNLELLGTGGNYSLTNTSNSFTNFAANTGSVDIYRAGAFTVGTAGGTSGVTTTGAARLFTGNSFTVSKPISAGGALTIGAATNVAVNANVSGSTVVLKPDTGGTGTGSVTFGAGIKATGSTVSIYANSMINYTANAIGTLFSYLYVTTLTGLQNMQNNLSGSYALNKDIDASSTATMNGGAGFVPIGNGSSNFAGNFDGQGHVISGLVINRPGSNFVGLFGATHNATISNVILANGSITGGVAVGSLIGYQSGGSVTGSSSSASVNGNLDVGGLVGFGDGLIRSSYMTGAVTGSDTVGGLVGDLFGTITQSYATGAVTAGSNVGGLVGYLEDGLGTVTASYWDTQTTGHDSHSGAGDTADAITGGITSAQFTTASNFAGWTFGTSAGSPGWVIVDADSTLNNAGGAAGATRPMLLSEASTTGTINDAHQLQLMALNLGSNYTLGQNIDMSETASASGVWLSAGFVPIGSATSDGSGFVVNQMFGMISANPYTGTFNGNNHTISNLYINRPDQDYVGLFGNVKQATLEKVTISGSITGRDHVGALLGGDTGFNSTGLGYLTTIDTVTSSAAVTGRDYVGGIAGSLQTVYMYTPTTIGAVSGRDYVGGIAGVEDSSSGLVQENASSTGSVSGRNTVGGLFGYLGTGLYDLIYSTGNVTGTGNNVGGLVGDNEGDFFTTSAYSTGAVTGNSNVGGIVGFNGSQVTNAFATGNVTGINNVGGVAGNNDGTTGAGFVDLSFATGIVRGTMNVGGLVGLNTNLIGALNGGGTYATGAVYGVTNVGGLVGANTGDSSTSSGRIVSSYSIGYVNGTTNVGGLVGNSTVSGANGFIKNSYFDTETSGKSAALGTGTTGTGGIATASMTKTTADLMSALQTGFSTSIWSFVTGTSLPYFKWLYSSAPQVVTGTAYSDRGTTTLVGAGANLYVNGLTGTAANVAASAVGSTGNNGFYYFLVPNGTFATSGKQVLVTTAGSSGGATFQEKTTASITGLSIYGTYLKEQATSTTTTLSALSVDLALAIAGNAAATSRLATISNLEIDATAASFALDQAINTNTLVLSSNGAVTESGTITAAGLLLSGTGSYALTNPNNAIGTVAANIGTVNVSDLSDLTVGTVAGTVGVTTTGATTLASSGDLTIASTAKVTAGGNNNVVLSAGGNFINNRGSDAVKVSGTGRWVIYSSAPGTDNFGNLNSGNTAIWNGTIGTLAPGSVASGNRYVFAYQPTLTVTTTDATKTYGQAGDVSSNYTMTGFQPGVAGAFLADTALSTYAGAPSLSSAGTDMYANVADGPFVITAGIGGLTAKNGYAFSFQNSGMLTVNPATLTYTTADAGGTYGTVSALGAISFSGLVAGDGSNIVGTEGLFSGSTAVPHVFNTNAGSYSEQVSGISGAGSSNYVLASTGNTTGTFAIDPRAITLTGNAASKIYGDGAPSYGYTVGGNGLVLGDTLGSVGVSSVGDALTADKGQYDITTANAVFSSGLASNYDITYSTLTDGLTVDARAITLAGNAASKVYGDGAPAYGYTILSGNLANSDTLGSVDVSSAGDAVTANKGLYDVTAADAVFSVGQASNYDITYATLINGLTVTARAITVTSNAASKVYGDGAPAYGYSVTTGNLANADVLGSVDVSSAGDATTANKGQYDVTTANAVFSSGLASNYDITYDTLTNGLTVTARAITLTGDAASKVYGDGAPTYGYSITSGNLANSDALGSVDVSSTGDATTANKGQYDVTTANAVFSSGLSSNYDITYGTLTDGLTVNARVITLVGNAGSKIYGDGAPTYGYTIGSGNLVNGDTLGSVDVSSAGDAVTANKGQYDVGTANAVFSSGSASNYDVTYSTLTNGLTVTARAITLTGDLLTRVYGDANPANSTGAVTNGNLVNGDAISGVDVLSSTASATSNVGNSYSYAIGNAAFSSGDISNYDVTYVDGSLTINVRPITVTADAKSKTYGNGNPTLTFTTSYLGAGTAMLGSLDTVADNTTGVGSYGITQGLVTNATNSNYDITYVGADLAINARPITIVADAQTRTYGDANPALTYVIGGDGLVNGDTLMGGLATGASVTSNVGGYAITQGSLAASGNYAVSYTPGTLTVTPRALTVSADDLSRVYGDANPALTYGITGGNLVNGDTLTGGLATVAGLTSNAGSYAVTQGLLAASSNYTLSYVGGALAVTPRAITVTANDLSRIYGSANPLLTYAVGGSGLVNGDALTGGLATSASLHSNVGSYGITQGNLASSPNYVMTFNAGTLALTPASLLISANNSSALTLASAQPTASYIGLVAGDTSSVVTGLQLGLFPVTNNPFAYDIVPFGASAQNYAISYTAGLLTLTAQPSNIFTSPVTPGGALGTLPGLVLVTGSGTFTFSNVATAAIGADPSILLFDAGLPGDIGAFNQFVITDYSNAIDDSDRLVAAE